MFVYKSFRGHNAFIFLGRYLGVGFLGVEPLVLFEMVSVQNRGRSDPQVVTSAQQVRIILAQDCKRCAFFTIPSYIFFHRNLHWNWQGTQSLCFDGVKTLWL